MDVKINQGETVQLRGVVRRILVLKLKKATKMLMELLKMVMEVMSLEQNYKKFHANENNDCGKEQSGKVVRSTKDGSDEAENNYESAKKRSK